MIVIKLLYVEIINYLCTCLRETFNRTVLELKEKTTSVDRQFFGIVDLNALDRANFYYRRFET